MAVCIKIIGLVNGGETPFDGKYIRYYDPHYLHDGAYEGGKLEVTPDRREARPFSDAVAAMRFWKSQHGIRPDGEPNRPLTAFSVEIEPL